MMASMDRLGTEPDYRYTLANERTLLAYLRTALALDATGVGAVQLLKDVHDHWVRVVIGVLLATAGAVSSAGGYLRWRSNQQAMRTGASVTATRLPVALAAIVTLTSLIAALGIVIK